jgi:katanin p80 WD40 repeat-containing subunit B1
MKKRNSKIHEFILTSGAKPLCAKLGASANIMASGDSLNTVSLWRLNKDRPIISLTNSTGSTQNPSEINCVSFGVMEDEVYSGSNRGAINAWDINSQKLITTLKGHTVNVSCITPFDCEDRKHLILSGSYDSNIKSWDLRQKNCVNTYKGHSLEVKCLQVSPDGRWFISGGQDSLIKVWDIAAGKVLHTFNNHDSPVSCCKFNPFDLTIASGAMDRTVKYFELETWGMLYSSTPEATGILAMAFSQEGQFLFSAAQESLKVWKVEADKLRIVDNVESNWRGVQDLAVGQTDEGISLLGVTISPVCFGLWSTPFKAIGFDGNNKPAKSTELPKSRSTEPKPATTATSTKAVPPKSYDSVKQLLNYDGSDKDYNSNEMNENKPIAFGMALPRDTPQQQQQPIPVSPQSQPINNVNPSTKMQEEKKVSPVKRYNSQPSSDKVVVNDDSLAARLLEFASQVESNNKMPIEPETVNDRDKTSIIRFKPTDMDMTYSEFLTPEQKKQNDLLGDLMKDHSKFKGIMNNRINALKPVLHWWSTGNSKPALNAINMMNINEPTLVLDLLNMSLAMHKGTQIIPETGLVFLQKSSVLLDSKIDVHIRKGMEIIAHIFKMFQDDIIAIKCVPLMGGVDIAREDRMKKYDKLIDEVNNVYNKDALKRRAERKKDDLGEASAKLRNDLEVFLKKVGKIAH